MGRCRVPFSERTELDPGGERQGGLRAAVLGVEAVGHSRAAGLTQFAECSSWTVARGLTSVFLIIRVYAGFAFLTGISLFL